ncbi:MAG: J domain-containing protein [Candidatus Polarisedimenticolia bacterium]
MQTGNGPYPARLAVVLGHVARGGLSGKVRLSAARGDAGGYLRFARGTLVLLVTHAGSQVDPAEVAIGAVVSLVEEATKACAKTDASPDFTAEPESGPGPLKSPTAAELALRISRMVGDEGWLVENLGGRSARLAPAGSASHAPRVALGPGEGFLLSRADGTLTLGEILDTSPMPGGDALRTLFALRAIGMLAGAPSANLSSLDSFLSRTARAKPATAGAEAVDEADLAYAPEERKERQALRERCLGVLGCDHYTILGVERSANEAAIRSAYYKLARQYHPDRLHKPHLEDMLQDLEAFFAAMTQAYNTLSDSKTRAEYESELHGPAQRRSESMDRTAMARDAYLRGRKAAEKGDLFEAIRLFETATENDPGRAEYFHYLGACQGQNPHWRKKAEESLQRAIRMNPAAVASYVELARLYRKGGLERKSHEMYAQVLKWDPTHKEALANTGKGQDAPQAGLLRGLFRKP